MDHRLPLISLLFVLSHCAAQEPSSSVASRPEISRGLTSLRTPSPIVQLGLNASLPSTLNERGSGLRVSFRLLGASPTKPETRGTEIIYPDVLGSGVNVIFRHAPRGLEDVIHFPERPAEEVLRYELDLEGVAALRQVPETEVVEFLDAQGTPRLRICAPWGKDAQGRRFEASLEVRGCAVERDPGEPWGRTHPPPGAERCILELGWSSSSYPVVIDPIWQTTENLSAPRARFTATKLQDGRVLVSGGTSTGNKALATAEIYDPATGTWAMTGTMPVPRKDHRATMLPDGSVLVVGGVLGPSRPLRYSSQAGIFVEVGQPVSASNHDQISVSGGDILVVGGGAGNGVLTYRIETSKNFNIKPVATLHEPRFSPYLVGLSDERVLVIGGSSKNVSLEVFNPASNEWTQHFFPYATKEYNSGFMREDGSVFLFGKDLNPSWTDSDNNVFDPQTEEWKTVNYGFPYKTHVDHTLTRISKNVALVVGGFSEHSPLEWRKANERITFMSDYVAVGYAGVIPERKEHQTLLLDDGSTLVIGGSFQEKYLADVLRCLDGFCYEFCESDEQCLPGYICTGASCLLPREDGQPCAFNEDCLHKNCVEGVCCNELCDGPCISCLEKRKGSGKDGLCEPIAKDTNPKDGCLVSGKSCGPDGLCDGNGECKGNKPQGATCSEVSGEFCAQDGTCDENGECNKPQGTPCSDEITCKNGYIGPSACDGKGGCTELAFPETSCFPYGCHGKKCATNCTSDSGCFSGYACSEMSCVPAETGAGGSGGAAGQNSGGAENGGTGTAGSPSAAGNSGTGGAGGESIPTGGAVGGAASGTSGGTSGDPVNTGGSGSPDVDPGTPQEGSPKTEGVLSPEGGCSCRMSHRSTGEAWFWGAILSMGFLLRERRQQGALRRRL